MHSKLAACYQDHYRVNTLPLYLEIVQKYSSIQRRAFPVPTKTTPSPAMGIGKMKAFIKEMWTSNDREMIVRFISSNVPEHTLITDYTFEVARLLDDSKCCCIVLNEKQLPLFIGFCDTESDDNCYRAHWYIKNRLTRLSLPMPTRRLRRWMGQNQPYHQTALKIGRLGRLMFNAKKINVHNTYLL